MITEQNLSAVIGSTAVGSDGKLGTVGEVYLDDETGRPEWATVRTGMFGTKESFVPLADADLSGDDLRLPTTRTRSRTPRRSTPTATSPRPRSPSSTATTASAPGRARSSRTRRAPRVRATTAPWATTPWATTRAVPRPTTP
ncbi:PRC-barrel domain-containing protein [Blastococcus brunescens]|uniref:PRC-barrel domain-containing protein n=1 Tax=Blastococcus brunescens TaxID=1564165 RepID=A0ABZ1B663_9ACTN|nr:PRC-barrel domain-containing protein [Blastococcus sp. BMG 8361]WRL66281.1 PRC-barrel domain-containing protein [Blastococcus sp. BMG 8361]